MAYAWLVSHAQFFNIDTTKIVVGGDSAGAHLALFFGPLGVRAIIDFFGPTDLTQPDMYKVTLDLDAFGKKSLEKDRNLYVDASPIYRMEMNNTPPVLIFHGTKDDVIPYSQSVLLKNRLDIYHIPCIMVSFNGAHRLDKLPWYTQLYLEMRAVWFALENTK